MLTYTCVGYDQVPAPSANHFILPSISEGYNEHLRLDERRQSFLKLHFQVLYELDEISSFKSI